jgi:redox-sensitive bicupin YhaK (pirin superfamily)
MITLRPSAERGGADHGWLKTCHTFSFNTYHDPAHTNFRALRVINEDWIAPGQGFGTHPHDNMEIITYVLEGALEHKDSLGTGSIIRPGDAQRMSAGTGIRHSEYNASETDTTHMLQIWIMPNQRNVAPGYEQRVFPDEAKAGKFLKIAEGLAGADTLVRQQGGGPRPVSIHADADLYVSVLKAREKIAHTLAPNRHAWLQVTKGAVELNGEKLGQGDGASASDEPYLEIQATTDAEVLLFDLA